MKANYSFSDKQKLSECHQEPALQDPGEQLFAWKERTPAQRTERGLKTYREQLGILSSCENVLTRLFTATTATLHCGVYNA